MNREQRLQAWPVAVAPKPGNRAALPVLIQVPRVASSAGASVRGAAARVQRPRRRLRREVRYTLYALIATLPPAVIGLAAYREGRQAALLEIRPPRVPGLTVEEAPPPRISLSIEPAGALPPPEPAAPVVFPGYLLPDDGLEDPAHAGD